MCLNTPLRQLNRHRVWTPEQLSAARVRLEFFGQVYDLKADDQEVDVRDVVDYVHEKTREQETAHRGLPPHKLVVLTVLNMGKDYIVARNRLREMEDTLASRAGRLVTKIDSVIDRKS